MKHPKHPHPRQAARVTLAAPGPIPPTPAPGKEEQAPTIRASAADTFVAAVRKSMSPKTLAIAGAELPEDVAAVLKESFWGVCELAKTLGELGSACQEGDVEKVAAAIQSLPMVMGGAERVLLTVAAHHGVDMGEVVMTMQRIHNALHAAYEADVRPSLRLV